jgi:Protein of unknown function (DUF2909)
MPSDAVNPIISSADNVTIQNRKPSLELLGELFDMGYFIALFLLLIIASLASAGFFMLRRKEATTDDGQKKSALEPPHNQGMVRALTIRIGLSVVLFISVLVAWQLGLIQPTGLPLK